MTWYLDLRADNAGGNPARGEDDYIHFDAQELVSAIRGKYVLLVTHGFNVNRLEGIDSLSKWAGLLNFDADSIFVGVLWPGGTLMPTGGRSPLLIINWHP